MSRQAQRRVVLKGQAMEPRPMKLWRLRVETQCQNGADQGDPSSVRKTVSFFTCLVISKAQTYSAMNL